MLAPTPPLPRAIPKATRSELHAMAPRNGQRSFALKECKLALKTSTSFVKEVLRPKGITACQSIGLPRLPLSEAEEPEPEGEFVLFTKLPTEIRIQIWKIVIADSRLIMQVIERAVQHWLTRKCTFRKHSWRKKFQFIGNLPAVLHVCSLSRELAKSTWRTRVDLEPDRPHFSDYGANREVLEICLADCASNPAHSPSHGMYEAEYQDYTLLVNAFDYVDEFGIKAIAMDLKKWSTVESEQDWCDRISTFLQFPEILSLERIILFYSESDICQDKLAFSKSMTEDFVTRSDSPLSVIRDDAIRELIQTDERFSSCTVEDWKLPKFDFVLRSEWRQWLGTWADRHDTCLHKIPYIRSLKYRIPGYRCDLERARWRLKGLLRWPWR